MKQRYWLIKHSPTGGYIGAPNGDRRTCGTHCEVVPLDQLEKHPPRVFYTQGSATRALTHWLKGKITNTAQAGGWWSTFEVEERPERRREDMEIVEVTVELP